MSLLFLASAPTNQPTNQPTKHTITPCPVFHTHTPFFFLDPWPHSCSSSFLLSLSLYPSFFLSFFLCFATPPPSPTPHHQLNSSRADSLGSFFPFLSFPSTGTHIHTHTHTHTPLLLHHLLFSCP